MSERKTAEIKFRVTPTFKASLQAAAQAADETMSVYIENAVELRRQAETQPIKPPLESGLESWGLHSESEQALALEAAVPAPFTGTPVPLEEADAIDLEAAERVVAAGEGEWLTEESFVAHNEFRPGILRMENLTDDASPQEDVTTSDEVGASEEPQYPWMFRS